MKVEGFRTTKFRNIIKQIAENNNADLSYKEVKFTLGTTGDTKSIRLNGKVVDDVIAIYYTSVGLEKHPHVITYGDYTSFVRDMKVSEVLGETVEVKSFQKPKAEPDEIKVGNLYLMRFSGNSTSTSIVKIIKKTKTTATYQYIAFRWPAEIEEKRKEQEYYVQCDIKDVEILGPMEHEEKKVRATKSGSWRTSAGWGAGHIDVKGTKLCSSQYFD